ncbi:MAG: NFACT family protein [Candidatus Helarchaeota archaeon]|nr:NFACT family protein [Candidatus Helarchaeota archaeon]
MSSFDIAAIVSELKPILTHAWISNVYHLDSIFELKFRTKEGNLDLLIEAKESSKRIHLTSYERPKPKVPSKFCMTLRKYLRNQRVLEIKQYRFDRVVIIEVGRLSSDQDQPICQNKLVIEFFERGNLLLLDPEGKVLIALTYRTMRDRRIIPNREYNFAPSRGADINEVQLQEFKEVLKSSDQNLIRTLISNLNMSPIYAEELCFRAQLNKETPAKELTEEESQKIFAGLNDIRASFQKKQFSPTIYHADSKDILAPIELSQLASANKDQTFKSFNEASDRFFSSKEEIKTQVLELKEKKTELSKKDKILKKQQVAIKELEENSIRYKKLGDLVYQYFQSIQELLTSIKTARDNGRPWEEIEETLEMAKKKNIAAAKLVTKIDYANANLILTVEGEEIAIDFRQSVQENANVLYTKGKKAESKLKGAKIAYQQMLKQKGTAEIEAGAIEKKERKLVEKRKKHWYEKFHWFFSSDNILVIGGRDLKTNELVFKKYLEEKDIFFHASFQGAPVVVIKTEGKEVPEQSFNEAAQFAVTFSSAWKSQLGQADVYCVDANQVSQSPPSGEYLKKGSFIVKGKKREFKNIPLKIKVGVKFQDASVIVASGPPAAIEKYADFSVEVKFGNKNGAFLAKILKDRFIKACSDENQREALQNLSLDEIQRSIPGGTGDISD